MFLVVHHPVQTDILVQVYKPTASGCIIPEAGDGIPTYPRVRPWHWFSGRIAKFNSTDIRVLAKDGKDHDRKVIGLECVNAKDGSSLGRSTCSVNGVVVLAAREEAPRRRWQIAIILGGLLREKAIGDV